MKAKKQPIIEREKRPETKGEAREPIRKIYTACGWDEGDQIRNHAMLELPGIPLDELGLDEYRIILDDMARHHMVRFA